jgi:hypothetical protein
MYPIPDDFLKLKVRLNNLIYLALAGSDRDKGHPRQVLNDGDRPPWHFDMPPRESARAHASSRLPPHSKSSHSSLIANANLSRVYRSSSLKPTSTCDLDHVLRLQFSDLQFLLAESLRVVKITPRAFRIWHGTRAHCSPPNPHLSFSHKEKAVGICEWKPALAGGLFSPRFNQP